MRIDVHVYHHFPTDPANERWRERIEHALANLKGIAMTTAADLNARADAIEAKLDAAAASSAAIRQDIADLKATLPTSGGMTQEEVDAFGLRLDGIGAKADAVASDLAELDSENPAPPAP